MYHIMDLLGLFFEVRLQFILELNAYLRKAVTNDVLMEHYALYRSLEGYLSHQRFYVYDQDKEMECSICLEEYDTTNYDDQVLIDCGHRFHGHCLNRFEDVLIERGKSLKCPQCNQWNRNLIL